MGPIVHRLGTYALILGAVLCVAGLIFGFGLMFAGHDDPALLFLGLVPLSFVIGFAGMVMTLLNPPGASD